MGIEYIQCQIPELFKLNHEIQHQMTKNPQTLICLLAIFMNCGNILAQEALVSAGGNANGSGGTASYSIGQVAYLTISDNDATLSQGVQQTFEINVISTIDNSLATSLSILVYPNPTSNFLELVFEDIPPTQIKNLRYKLTNIEGKQLSDEEINSTITLLDLSNFSNSIYHLGIFQNNRLLKNFKISKN